MLDAPDRAAPAQPAPLLTWFVTAVAAAIVTLAAAGALRAFDAAASTADQASAIYAVGVDGGIPARVVGAAGRAFWGPSFSPDGRRLAFSAFAVGRADAQLVVANADGSGMRPITHDGLNNYLASWSPDGARLVFICQQGGDVTTAKLCRVDADGTDEVRLTTNNAQEYGASWSPNGKRIVFGSKRDGKNDLFMMNADGTNPINLTKDAPLVAGVPAWSPDGKRVAFHASDTGPIATWRPRVLRGIVLIVHAALIVALLLGIARRFGWALGRLTLIAVVAGALLAAILDNPTLVIAVPPAGFVADILAWRLRSALERLGARRAASFLVPLVLYGIPVLLLSEVEPNDFPVPYAQVLALTIGLTGLAVSYATLRPPVRLSNRAWRPERGPERRSLDS